MSGVKGRSGRRKKPLAHHILTGGYRRDRHGELPPGGRAAVLLQMPTATPHEPDLDALTTGLQPAGLALVTDMLAQYDNWAPADLRYLRLGAELLDRRSELRAVIAALGPGQTDQVLRLLHAERRTGSEFVAAMRALNAGRDSS
jgi:hypothetical protein